MARVNIIYIHEHESRALTKALFVWENIPLLSLTYLIVGEVALFLLSVGVVGVGVVAVAVCRLSCYSVSIRVSAHIHEMCVCVCVFYVHATTMLIHSVCVWLVWQFCVSNFCVSRGDCVWFSYDSETFHVDCVQHPGQALSLIFYISHSVWSGCRALVLFRGP